MWCVFTKLYCRRKPTLSSHGVSHLAANNNAYGRLLTDQKHIPNQKAAEHRAELIDNHVRMICADYTKLKKMQADADISKQPGAGISVCSHSFVLLYIYIYNLNSYSFFFIVFFFCFCYSRVERKSSVFGIPSTMHYCYFNTSRFGAGYDLLQKDIKIQSNDLGSLLLTADPPPDDETINSIDAVVCSLPQ